MNSDTITATTDNQQTYILVTDPLISRHANGQQTKPVHSTSHPQVYTHIKPAYLPIGHSCIKLIQQTVHRRSYSRFMATWPCSHHCSRGTIHNARIYIRRKNNLELHIFNIFKVSHIITQRLNATYGKHTISDLPAPIQSYSLYPNMSPYGLFQNDTFNFIL